MSQSLFTLLRPLKPPFQFEWSDSTIRYLGVELSSKVEQLYQVNFPQLYNKLEAELKGWAIHELSWLGRINAIKMTLKLLYIFRSLPIPLRTDHLRKFQGKLLKFTWGTR